ncbi:hypothetical protein [Geminocystis herdmanii]|uniref:hypothetical protein n=1 Tax=Geminocystis herdmanii TaxID=669359 RepID=UPI0003477550|nr:hypothetical protein [Geminocystis herdmanii]
MQGKEVKQHLDLLTCEAQKICPDLTNKLQEINLWIKDKKNGLLTSKKFVSAFLIQLIQDSYVWLELKKLSSSEAQKQAYEQMKATERYWYSILFPQWLRSKDAKLYIWKKKLMAGEYEANDEILIQVLSQKINQKGGVIFQRYIADFSMATDIIVSHSQNQSLCVQLTTVDDKYVSDKYKKWQETLEFWEINRGLFSNYNPADKHYLDRIVNLALYNSNNLSDGKYLKIA